MLLRLHHYAQTRPDADRWLAEQITRFASPEPVEWREWLSDAIADWREEWLPVLDKAWNSCRAQMKRPPNWLLSCRVRGISMILKSRANTRHLGAPQLAGECQFAKRRQDAGAPGFPANPPLPFWRKSWRRTKIIRRARRARSANRWKNFFADAAFLHSLMPMEGSREPLAEDWDWIRGHMTALLQLAQEFGQKFAERKRADGVLDFHDLEQFALKLLWDSATDKPTAIAERWRQKIRFVFVDEYQDINAAQDKIIQALSRDEGWGETPASRRTWPGLNRLTAREDTRPIGQIVSSSAT